LELTGRELVDERQRLCIGGRHFVNGICERVEGRRGGERELFTTGAQDLGKEAWRAWDGSPNAA
jgi:hypothetical protein